MPRKPTTREMSDAHEEFLAELIDGRRTPGSGNQFNNQMDVRNDHRRQTHAFGLDGKSTFAESITIKRTDIEKAREQSHDLAPGLALRWYPDWSLRNPDDWILVQANDFEDLLADARAYREGGAP